MVYDRKQSVVRLQSWGDECLLASNASIRVCRDAAIRMGHLVGLGATWDGKE